MLRKIRKKDGLCTKLSIRHNIALPNLDLICGKGGVINTKVEEELCDKAVADLTDQNSESGC